MRKERDTNFKWIANQNLTGFKGLWIAVVDKEIVSKGEDARKVVDKARKKHPKKTPFLLKVPSTETLTM